ncbi:MAG: translation initiation factor IF-2 [bacterium]|nr:translation initiation factor IF-2 [bacterium]
MASHKVVPKKKPPFKKRPGGDNRVVNVPVQKAALPADTIIYYRDGLTVADLAEALDKPVAEVIKKLMFMRIMASQTQAVDRETAELIVLDYGYELKDEAKTDMTKFEEMDIIDDPKLLIERSPVVTIMGHVDHGKTTLLDTIRHTRVVQTEAGGITQRIGAYQVIRNAKPITFIDTPGHAAFTEMRARGAKVTDMIVLVVAADDGVMPQTKEAIDHAKAAGASIIVAVNKMDRVGANPERVKQELADLDLLPDDWGGSTPYCYISALKGTGVDNLLDTIQLVAEMLELKANPKRMAMGSVVEAKLDKGKGPIATVLVSNGTLKIGDFFVVGTTYGKIRAMTDDLGRSLVQAPPSTPVEISGLSDVPFAGDPFMVFADERTAKDIASKRSNRSSGEEKGIDKMLTLEEFFKKAESNEKVLRLIIKGDTQGSIEAFKGAIDKIKVLGTNIEIVRAGVGAITDTDVSLAEASNAIIIGFDVRPQAQVRDTAENKGVEIRLYNIIYEALEDIERAMKGMLDPVFEKQIIGEAEVRNIFTVSKTAIAGCMVLKGAIKRDSLVKVIREGKVVFDGKISSLKRFKDDVKEVKTGYDCGIMLEGFHDFKELDIIEASIMQEVKPNA